MIQYLAPNPYPEYKSIWSWFPSLFSRSSSSESIGSLILPARWDAPEQLSQDTITSLEQYYNLTIEVGYVATFDGAVLDTIQLTPKTERVSCYIIKFNGNGTQFQHIIKTMAEDAARLKACVISFNYRGVGKSTRAAENYQQLITDGIAQVQRLLAKGIPSTAILLDGLSLGGSVATMVAEHFHRQGSPIYLWNDRSFSTITKASAGIITPSKISSVETAVSSVLYMPLAAAGWRADVASAYKAIPREYKGYMFVSKKSCEGKGDGVISHAASLHRGVKPDEKKLGITTGHKVYANSGAGHNKPRNQLFSPSAPNKSGQEIFDDFVVSHTHRA
jgi:alpha/beta superfamily hydrolase